MRLAALYTAFAVLAILANLAAQRLVLALLGDAGFALAVLVGTGVGLVLKYLLDKRWIFEDRETGARAHSRKFGLYTAMGLVTTAIFWGFETLAWMTWQTDFAREAGAVLGLAIGYVVKYRLDRRFTFRTAPA
ncbi:Putative flippase GtrA (transmembrane translocase of bactoprenol-linked glucose) [Pseudooceanicola antarcticus]|uniref:Polysaccharide biosynthesis protein GtrA n=1 Tax=Pseudooceanicola antarcticus TaxID=1247613 RepID=A0A285IEG9_9RHOB|nr:GtrA family protein [Pseudooceanicola antarcticus]PJE29168.1 polysaccharide biosynthesis protein GtrA [Pseudooceanicola antarcticus]SNY46369.1 Putative flippase GtrA (transmembrane translocase of bactoprenol-linked glucose) [Pseudooceanicola antarcticus]